MTGEVYTSGPIELRLGRYQEALADISECDAVIVDPPYSARTHEGMRSGNDAGMRTASKRTGVIVYDSITEDICREWAALWVTWRARFIVVFSDHTGWYWRQQALAGAGYYTFGPVAWVKPNMPRFGGDGPALTTEWVCVARPRAKPSWYDSRPGHYLVDGNQCNDKRHGQVVAGQKPLTGMRQIVRDYTRPGDLIIDPCAGGATTLIAAAMEGRRAIGAECDPTTYAKAVRRLQAGYTMPLFGGAAWHAPTATPWPGRFSASPPRFRMRGRRQAPADTIARNG